MHIYFSGIGGAGIGPLAQIARQAGYSVSGSDQQDSQYIDYLRQHGITNIHIGQSADAIAAVHAKHPIDWFVYTSALPLENADAPELIFCRSNEIHMSKRDELLNQIVNDKKLQMIAVAGTHGKTTTTAMVTWFFRQLGLPISYLLPAKTSFAAMGEYNPDSTYFIYEADEFDRNFLAYEPAIGLITGVSWDHHEVFPTREEYQAAFREFIAQTGHTFVWQEDAEYLGLAASESITFADSANPDIETIQLKGRYNRLDAALAMGVVRKATGAEPEKLFEIINRFPGLSRRMELIIPNLYSDYAHTPEKIRGAMSVASEMAAETGQKLVVVYEPLTNRRQHYMIDNYHGVFEAAAQLYWIPSYLAREDQDQRIIPPSELIAHLDQKTQTIAAPFERNDELKQAIQMHVAAGDMVVCMAGGGGNSLDDWIRSEFHR